MVPISSIFFIFVVTSVSSDDPYIPCQSYISFSYDDSGSISYINFKTQMNFIKNAIGSLNYPARLRAEGGYGSEFNWKSGLTISRMQSAIDAAEQTAIPYSLLQQFSSLAISYENLNDYSSRFGAMIFISDTSDSALRNAGRLFPKLKGIRLTFVLLGPNVDSRKLRNFTTNFIYWPDISQPAPDNWDLVSFHAYGCDAPYNPTSTKPVTAQSTQTASQSSSTTTTSATTTLTPGSTPSQEDYVPCQVFITTLVDISNALSFVQFQKQLTFTKNLITQINHPERIQYGAYYEGNGNMTYKWNDANTQDGLQQAIDNTKQTSLSTSLAGAMRVSSIFAPQNRTILDSTIIFVTDTTNSIQIQSAVNLYNSLLKPRGVRLTFILAGNKTDANALRGFDDVIIFNWQNMNNSQPDNWDNSQALRCTGLSSTTPTISTQGSSTATSVSPSTLTSGLSTSIQSSTTTSSGYIPCQSWISFGTDDSNVLQNNEFMTQLNFVSSAIGNITHTERIAAIGAYSQPVTWNSGLSLQLIQQTVVGMFQGGPYSLKQQFASILWNLQNTQTGNTPVGALIFISDTSDQALADVANIFGQLQNVRITFVLLGPNPDKNKLTQFSNNFISWRDLSKPQPDNWDTQAADAYGCTISTVSTVTPITMSSPSSVSITRGGVTIATVQTVPPQTSSSASTSTSAILTGNKADANALRGTPQTFPPPTMGSYIPCQSWISFGVDDSNFLQDNQFMTQLNFISSAIGNITHAERIAANGMYSTPVPWNSGLTISQIQSAVTQMFESGPYSLGNQFASILWNLQNTQTGNTPVGALIFISDTSDPALAGTDQLFNHLTNVRITFVLLGPNPDQSKLTNFSSSFITWRNLSQPQPIIIGIIYTDLHMDVFKKRKKLYKS